MENNNIITLQDSDDFNNLTSSPTLIDFTATWCGPCKVLSPIIDAVAEKYKNKIKVIKVDVGKFPEIAGKCGVRSVPTLVLFNNGNIVDGLTGLVSMDKIEGMIERYI